MNKQQLLKNISPIYDNVNQDDIRKRMIDFVISSGCTIDQESKYEVVFQMNESMKPDDIRRSIKDSEEVSKIARYFSMGFTPNKKFYLRIKRINKD